MPGSQKLDNETVDSEQPASRVLLYRILLIRKWAFVGSTPARPTRNGLRPEGFFFPLFFFFFSNEKETRRSPSFQQGVFLHSNPSRGPELGNNESFRDYHDSYFPGNAKKELTNCRVQGERKRSRPTQTRKFVFLPDSLLDRLVRRHYTQEGRSFRNSKQLQKSEVSTDIKKGQNLFPDQEGEGRQKGVFGSTSHDIRPISC